MFLDYFYAILKVMLAVEKIAYDIRIYSMDGINEMSEPFSKGQKGSSAMPHKRNPILSENLTGLARLMRSWADASMVNVALWHERDISHSSVERMIAPDATITLDFLLARLTSVIENLVVYPERMQANLDELGGLVFSQRVLLALTQAGMTREDAYAAVQRNAMESWSKGLSFLNLLKADSELNSLIDDRILESMFDLSYHTKNVDIIFKRVFG